MQIIRSYRPHVIFTTSPPHSVHLAGLLLKKHTHIPWIADFRENWLAEEYEDQPTLYHRHLNQWMLRQVINKADRILSVSQHITNDLRIQSHKAPDHFITLYNGYDSTDFEIPLPKKRSKFTMTYCGTMSPIRSPETFLNAMRNLFDKQPDLKDKIEIRFVGSCIGLNIVEMIHRFGLEETVCWKGYVTHRDSIQYLMDSDLILLFISPNSSPGMITGKLFEYLASGKPILAAIPAGEAEELILRYHRGRIVDPEDEQCMADTIFKMYTDWKKGSLQEVSSTKDVSIFDRRELTKKLSQVFNRVI
jgi:glycosyltransferase involved in cell wall biosynthesis